METPNPLQGMSPSELKQRYPSFYPESPKVPTPGTAPIPSLDGLKGLTPNELAKGFPQFYPDGPTARIPDLPKPSLPDPLTSMSREKLAQKFPQFYPDAVPVAPPTAGKGFSGLPQIPKTAAPSLPLGDFVRTPVGGGVLAGAYAGAVGLATGAPLEVAAGQAIGAGIGTVLGGAAGSVFGPVGSYIGAGIGGTVGAVIGGNIGQSIHDGFHPPASVQRGPLDPVKLPPNVPGGYPPGTTYIVRFASEGRTDEIRMRSFSGASYTPKDKGFKRRTFTAYGVDVSGASPAVIEGIFTYEAVSISVIPEVNGQPQKTLPIIPDFEQTPYPQPMIVVLPTPIQSVPPLPKTAPPPTLPQSQPSPSPSPKLEPPGRKPQIAPSTPPKTTPDKPDPDKPVPNQPTDPLNNLPNLNNLPGLFGLPFIPAVMPANKPSPAGSIKIDPGSGGTGSGKPPKAPANTPCNSACQKAIEGRIQGVDDKMGQLLNGANNAGQDAALAAIMARLAIIDAKLGAQAVGGLSGFLTSFREGFDRLAKWLHLDRILNVLTFATTLHNAYMLSNALTQTLFSMFSNVLAAVGLKDKEGSPLEVGKIVGSTIEAFAKSILGVEAVDGFKKEWKKYSRIYQAAANIVYSIQSIAFSILSALEVIGSMVGKIGNALKAGGAIFERAFGWMNVQPNFQNRFFTNIQAATELVSNIDSVAGEVLSIQDASKNLGDQKKELDKALSEQEAKDNATQKKVKEADATKPAITTEHEKKPEA